MAQQVQIVQRYSSNMYTVEMLTTDQFVFSNDCSKQQIVKFLTKEFEDMLDNYSEMTSKELESTLDVAGLYDYSVAKEDVVWAIMDNENSDFYDIFVLSVNDVISFEGNQHDK